MTCVEYLSANDSSMARKFFSPRIWDELPGSPRISAQLPAGRPGGPPRRGEDRAGAGFFSAGESGFSAPPLKGGVVSRADADGKIHPSLFWGFFRQPLVLGV